MRERQATKHPIVVYFRSCEGVKVLKSCLESRKYASFLSFFSFQVFLFGIFFTRPPFGGGKKRQEKLERERLQNEAETTGKSMFLEGVKAREKILQTVTQTPLLAQNSQPDIPGMLRKGSGSGRE